MPEAAGKIVDYLNLVSFFRRWRDHHRFGWRYRGGSRQTIVYRKPAVDISMTGLVYFGMMIFMGMAAVNTQANLLFGVFGLMIGVLFISLALCRLVLTWLRVERVIPDQVVVGQPATLQYEFFNTKRFWPSLSVTLTELDAAQAFARQPHAYMLHAAPRMSAMVPSQVMPLRRGLYRLNTYQVSTSFPFGFIKRAFLRAKQDTILIYPSIGQVSPRLLAICRSAERTGVNRKPRRGGADEFYGVKEFREGENPRWIHWKRSARTGQLVAREMAAISPPRLVILVDTCIEKGTTEEQAEVEKSIARAASLASAAFDSGMAVGLCAWAGEWVVMPTQRGKQYCREILATLAALPINPAADLSQLLQRSALLAHSDVTTVLFTSRQIQRGLGDRARGSMIVVSSGSEEAQTWFALNSDVDFTLCMPDGQIPPKKKSSK